MSIKYLQISPKIQWQVTMGGCLYACMLSYVWLSVTPWAAAHEAPISVGFPRQEYWNGLPFPSPGDLPMQELNSCLLHCRQILYHLRHQGSHEECGYKVVLNYGFDFSFLWWLMLLNIFSCAYSPFVCLFWRNIYSYPFNIFQLGDFLFHFWGVRIIYIL